ncbi:hypothetical protein C2E23DRAFT_807860 [Lenzites betulinus]|nr:hypothetical protein C2E23DRAFT_807860 [Lenzites betulinus]
MPGANYMGGKRNAARARGKDATGKAQRDHFGKKRFEILRNGLSRGQGGAGRVDQAANAPKARPEISFAHARRVQDGGRRHEDSSNMLLEPFTPSFAHTSGRTPPSSASSRSKTLKVLDAENSLVQRARVNKILQLPNLLGLSTRSRPVPRTATAHYSSPRSSSDSAQRTPASMSGHDDTYTSFTASPESPYPEYKEQHAFTQTHRMLAEPLTPSYTGSGFVPMCLDSSPPPYVHDYGYADSYDLREDHPSFYEPARIPYYSASSPLQESSEPRDALDTRDWRRLEDIQTSPLGQDLPLHDHLALSVPLSSTQSLPATMAQAAFLSDIPTLNEAPAQRYGSSLPPSESPSHSWSARASRFYDSDDIPQASFSLSPPAHTVVSYQMHDVLRTPSDSGSCDTDTGYFSADDSVYSMLEDTLDQDHDASLSGSVPIKDDPAQWQEICLSDLLHGALFEDADPWRALDDILDLPPLSALRLLGSTSEPEPAVPADAHSTCDDPGAVGYVFSRPPSSPPYPTIWATEDEEAIGLPDDEPAVQEDFDACTSPLATLSGDPEDRSKSLLEAGDPSEETLLPCPPGNVERCFDEPMSAAASAMENSRALESAPTTLLPPETFATSVSVDGLTEAQGEETISMSCTSTPSAADHVDLVRLLVLFRYPPR